MNVRVAKEEMALMLPNALSHYVPTESYQAPAPVTRGPLAWLGSMFRWLVELPSRRALLDELNTLSDHELSDIGLSRAELSRVFDPAFVAERDRRRGRQAA